MSYFNPAVLKEARKRKKIGQSELAQELDMPISTYSLKEREGGFEEDEIKVIIKKLGITKDQLFSLDKPGKKTVPSNSVGSIIEYQIKVIAMQTVTLSLIAELIAVQKDRSVASVQSEIKKLVNDEANSLFDELDLKK